MNDVSTVSRPCSNCEHPQQVTSTLPDATYSLVWMFSCPECQAISQQLLWEQLPNEPSEWFARFLLFKRLGSGRSIPAGYRSYLMREGTHGEKARKTHIDHYGDAHSRPSSIKPNGDWYARSKTWQWKRRAREWDRHVHSEDIIQHDDWIREEGERRKELLALLYEKVYLSVLNIEPEKFPYRDLPSLIRALLTASENLTRPDIQPVTPQTNIFNITTWLDQREKRLQNTMSALESGAADLEAGSQAMLDILKDQ